MRSYIIQERIEEHCRQHPAKTMVIDDDGAMTYGEFASEANSLACALQQLGVNSGQHVGLVLHNSRRFVVSYYAAIFAGAVPALISPALVGRELEHAVNLADVKAVIVDDGCETKFDEVRPRLVTESFISVGKAGKNEWIAYDDLVSIGGQPLSHSWSPEDVAAIHFTSGTTGTPKAVMLTNYNIIRTSELKAQTCRSRPESIMHSGPPLYHVAGANSVMNVGLTVLGATLVLSKTFDARKTAQMIAQYRVTFTWMVPPMFVWLLEVLEVEHFDLSSLESCLYAAMPMPDDVVVRLKRILPQASLCYSYGQTENSAFATCLVDEFVWSKVGSVGRPQPFTEIRVIDSQGRDAPQRTEGQILVKCPGIMHGYYKDQEATCEVLCDGWLRSGDMGYLDEDGFLYVVGRQTEMINRGGVKIAPAEVEEILLQHPAVAQVAVVGYPHRYLGEGVKAVVVLKEKSSVQPEDLAEFVKQRMAHYKVPKIFEFRADLPRNSLGKVQKHLLRQETSSSQLQLGKIRSQKGTE